MSKIVPAARPEIPRTTAELYLRRAGVAGPALLGRRGYYRDSMGVPGVQERGIYDDAIMLVTPTAFVTYNANCDPSRHRKGIANLKAGLWSYRLGIHGLSKPKSRQYPALVQAAPVTVLRDDPEDADRDGPEPDTGWFGINIHRGGYTTTSSEGCQTIYPDQWAAFFEAVKAEMKRHGLRAIPYLLTERDE